MALFLKAFIPLELRDEGHFVIMLNSGEIEGFLLLSPVKLLFASVFFECIIIVLAI